LQRVYPEYITCGEDGMPRRLKDMPAGWEQEVVKVARANGVKTLATMNNYANGGFEPLRIRKMINDKALMERHVDELIRLAKAVGMDGLDVDYESMDAEDRIPFTAFVTRLGEKAHAQGLLLGIAVHPKESEPGNWGGPMAQDYAALGKAVDFFHVMTYDYHWATSDAGSIAPPDWAKRVMEFTLTRVPASKVEMGMNGYGYEWSGKKGETMTWKLWQQRMAACGRPERNEATQELVLNCKGKEIWYPDAQTFMPKIKAARELGLRGLAMWVLGQEDPAVWRMWQKQKGTAAKGAKP
jgi:spore germination protein YaaH